ncbi:hypothetical protein BDZ91DRAFT_751670 [Kalaharituber pfeilii]|nr:hypothetical protein BDZ91DRAFT_751670 [Kalaharituber pfeilii]
MRGILSPTIRVVCGAATSRNSRLGHPARSRIVSWRARHPAWTQRHYVNWGVEFLPGDADASCTRAAAAAGEEGGPAPAAAPSRTGSDAAGTLASNLAHRADFAGLAPSPSPSPPSPRPESPKRRARPQLPPSNGSTARSGTRSLAVSSWTSCGPSISQSIT